MKKIIQILILLMCPFSFASEQNISRKYTTSKFSVTGSSGFYTPWATGGGDFYHIAKERAQKIAQEICSNAGEAVNITDFKTFTIFRNKGFLTAFLATADFICEFE